MTKKAPKSSETSKSKKKSPKVAIKKLTKDSLQKIKGGRGEELAGVVDVCT